MIYYQADLKYLQESVQIKKCKDKIIDKLVTLLIDYNLRPVRKTIIFGTVGIYNLFPTVNSTNKLMKFLNINDIYHLTSLIVLFASAYVEYRWHVSDAVMDYLDTFLLACVEAARMADTETKKMIHDVACVFKQVKQFISKTLQRFNESAELQYLAL